MLRSWDTIATNYKDTRMRFLTIGLAMLLFILLVMPYFTSEPIKQETITSTISYVGEPTTINGKSAYDTRFKLPDDTEVEMWVMQSPYPKIGDQVPLNVEHLSNGKKVYRIDYTKWRLGTNN